jgi:type II secretory pathway pseudopilin PulG
VKRDGGRLRLSAQDGYTAVEMIITMAMTAIVSGAIFSSFLVLDRIQTAWEQREQARAVGVLAEAPLLRDVQAYQVMTKKGDKLILQGVSTDPLSTPFKVRYFVQASPGGDSLLKRIVEQPPTPAFATTVAHGVQSIQVDCVGNTLTIGMRLDAISTRTLSTPESVDVSPVLTLTPRNGTCP